MAQQNSSTDGHHNIIVQVMGNDNRVNVGVAHLTLIPWQRRVRRAERDIDILDPACEAVPLIGREHDQAFLFHWLAGGGIAVTALVGPGGSGKTRLALDLLKRLPDGWEGGWLEAKEAQRFVNQQNLSEWGWQRSTLIVVDYASISRDILKDWLLELSDHDANGNPGKTALRILLLDRHADVRHGWYHDLTDASRAGERAKSLLRPYDPRHIAPLHAMEVRRAVLVEGMRRAATLNGLALRILPPVGTSAVFDTRLAQEQWCDPLLLLMAALSNDGNVEQSLSLSRRELAIDLGRREQDRLRRGVRERHAGPFLLHLYGCLTMCGGLDREALIQVADRELAAMQLSYPGGPGQAVSDLSYELDARDSLPGMTPDLLAEAFLLVVFGERDGFGEEVVKRISLSVGARVAPMLIRLVQDFGKLDTGVKVDDRGARWAELAHRWVGALVQANDSNMGVLVSVEAALPHAAQVMPEIGLALTANLVSRLKNFRNGKEDAGQIVLARFMNQIKDRLPDDGTRDSVLESLKVSAAKLYLKDPPLVAPELVILLTNLAHRQKDAKQYEAALSSISEAVKILRILAKGNRYFLDQFASSLEKLSDLQEELEKRENALDSINEAVVCRRELAEKDRKRYLYDLANSLESLSERQTALAQRAVALESIEEAERHYRELVEWSRDRHLPDLASCIVRVWACRHAMGKGASSLELIEEAVEIRREQVERDGEKVLPGLAVALSSLAIAQSLSRHHSALETATENVITWEKLVDKDRGRFLTGLVGALNTLSIQQHSLGQNGPALDSMTAATAMSREFVERDRNKFLPDLARSLHNLAKRQAAVGRLEAALTSIEEAVALYRKLAENNQRKFLPNLALSLSVLSDCLTDLRHVVEARDATKNGLESLTSFFVEYPDVFRAIARRLLADYFAQSRILKLEDEREVVEPYRSLLEGPEPAPERLKQSPRNFFLALLAKFRVG